MIVVPWAGAIFKIDRSIISINAAADIPKRVAYVISCSASAGTLTCIYTRLKAFCSILPVCPYTPINITFAIKYTIRYLVAACTNLAVYHAPFSIDRLEAFRHVIIFILIIAAAFFFPGRDIRTKIAPMR